MRIVYCENIKDMNIYNKNVLNGVDFLNSIEYENVIEACTNDANVLKKWFNSIGIKYDDIQILGRIITYTINNMQLPLSDLSSGERFVLYLMACKKLNKKVTALGLFERLGHRLELVVNKELRDYERLTVVYYNDLPVELEDCEVKEV